ncbi:MAG: response regulator [Polyangiaceae bacterium]
MTGPRHTILVVDDSPPNVKLLSFLFASKGYEVRTANGAAEALSHVARSVPDLILMDLQMPGIDGFELTRRIKGDPSVGNVVIIAVTAYTLREDEARARAAGCDAYVTKPIDTRTLPRLVADFLSPEPDR